MSRVIMRVAGGSNVNRLAGAIAMSFEEGKEVTLSAIGAGAINQMMKGLCSARQMMAGRGRDLVFTCGFTNEVIRGEDRTAIVVRVLER